MHQHHLPQLLLIARVDEVKHAVSRQVELKKKRKKKRQVSYCDIDNEKEKRKRISTLDLDCVKVILDSKRAVPAPGRGTC